MKTTHQTYFSQEIIQNSKRRLRAENDTWLIGQAVRAAYRNAGYRCTWTEGEDLGMAVPMVSEEIRCVKHEVYFPTMACLFLGKVLFSAVGLFMKPKIVSALVLGPSWCSISISTLPFSLPAFFLTD